MYPEYVLNTNDNTEAPITTQLLANNFGQNLMNQYKADVICVITNQTLQSSTGIAGFGFSGGPFTIVQIGSLLGPRFTFAHELGHQFGCLHQLAGENNIDCNHGHIGIGVFRTLVTVPFAGLPVILNYSNPDVTVGGLLTGSIRPDGVRTDDNANMIRNNACSVGERRSNPAFSASISGSRYVCSGDNDDKGKTYNLLVNPATPDMPIQPPYTIVWEWSASQLFTSPTIFETNKTKVTIKQGMIGNNNCDFVYIRAKITGQAGIGNNGIGQNLDFITPVRELDFSKCAGCFTNSPPLRVQKLNFNEFRIYPTPANDYLNFDFTSTSEQNGTIEINDLQGRLIKSFEVNLKYGLNHFDMYPTDFMNGTYIVNLKLTDNIITEKMIINNY